MTRLPLRGRIAGRPRVFDHLPRLPGAGLGRGPEDKGDVEAEGEMAAVGLMGLGAGLPLGLVPDSRAVSENVVRAGLETEWLRLHIRLCADRRLGLCDLGDAVAALTSLRTARPTRLRVRRRGRPWHGITGPLSRTP
jgi:hypothetical protein